MKGGVGERFLRARAGCPLTLCLTRSHCRQSSRTTEGSPRTHRCSPSSQCRAPCHPCPRTVEGEAEKERAARADPGGQAHAAAVGLAAAAARAVASRAAAARGRAAAARAAAGWATAAAARDVATAEAVGRRPRWSEPTLPVPGY